MRRYSAPVAFNNFKNSLKSRGSRIVAIGDLTEKFERLKPLGGSFRQPVCAVALALAELVRVHHRTIDLDVVRGGHGRGGWWARDDSNIRPLPCQGSALTN